MRIVFSLTAACGLAASLAGCATTQVVTPKAAPAGKLIKLAFYSDVRPNCASNGPVSVRVVQGPGAGQLEFRDAVDFRPYTLACNMTRVSGVQVWYRGTVRAADRAVLEVTYPAHAARVETFDIQVR